jgi:hypothetical protein
MKNNLLFLSFIGAILSSLFLGCDAEYFPRKGSGIWQGAAPLTVVERDTANVRSAVTRNAAFRLDLLQDENSQVLFTKHPRVTFSGNPADSSRAIIPADMRPLSTIILSGVRGDSTYNVACRFANVNTFILTVPSKTLSGQEAPISSVELPTVSFSGKYIDDNTVEGTLSQTIPALGSAPSRVFTSTIRLTK